MMQLLMITFCTLALLAGVSVPSCEAGPAAVAPFHTFNQSPLVQIYGLPAAESAIIQPQGETWSLLAFDLANNFASDINGRERIILDGESDRLTLAFRHGIGGKLEVGMDLPLVGYNGGIMDAFIEEWHSTFGLPQGNRTGVPHGRLLFRYERDGQERLRMDDSGFGMGDIRLTAGWQLYHDGSSTPAAVGVRAGVKLPTGSSSRLHGSGSTDLSIWLTGSDDYSLPGTWGHVTLFAASGGMAMTDGKVLRDQQRNFVGFGTLGFGWAPADWIAFKAQFSAHTPFYRGSYLNELNKPGVQLIFGGTLYSSSDTSLDIGISEDITVTASPDIAIHLGLSHKF